MTVSSCVVQIDTQVGPAGVSSPRVEAGQQVAVARQLLAAERALAGRESPARSASDVPWCGEPSVTTRRASAAWPSATHSRATSAAGRVADDVDALRAGPGQRRVDRRAEGVGGRAEVAGAVAGQLDDRGVAAGGGQHVGQGLHRAGRAAVPGHQQHRTGPLLRRPARPQAPSGRDDERHGQDGDRDDDQRQEGEDDASAGGGESRRALPYCPCCRRARHRPWDAGWGGAVLSREEYLAAWSRWHGGAGTEQPAGPGLAVAGLRAGAAAGRPAPVAATALGLLVAVAAVGPAAAGGTVAVAAGVLVGLSGLLDSLDGALAIGTGRASRRGFVLDSVVDRLTEAAYAAALWVAGAPGWLAVAFGALCWLPDYLRARAGQAGVRETGALSVWERPTRVILAGLTLVGAGVVAGLGAADAGGDGGDGRRGGARGGRRRPAGGLAAPDAGRLSGRRARSAPCGWADRRSSPTVLRCAAPQQGTRHRAALPPTTQRERSVPVAVTGSIATDHLMTFPGNSPSSSSRARWRTSRSPSSSTTSCSTAVAPARTWPTGWACSGLQPVLVGAVGSDFAEYEAWLTRHGVDTASVHWSELKHTARFVCTTDVANNQIASFYSGAMSEAGEIELGPVEAGSVRLDLVVVGPNDPKAMVRHTEECRQRGLPRSRPTPASSWPGPTAR